MKMMTITAVLLALLLAACSGSGQPPGNESGREVATIALTPATATIEVGQTQTFMAAARDASGNPVSASFEWTSSNPPVASVTGGVATGLAGGVAEITASSGGVKSNAAMLTVSAEGAGDDNGDEPAPAVSNTIAYLRTASDGDEIRLVNPDGTNDRRLWSTTQGDFEGTYSITSLAWRPDGRALAFTSDHEAACSWYATDVYIIRSDGKGLRRVSNAPACSGLVGFPKGRVTVGVQNHTFSSALFQVYVQGATKLEQISLGPGAGGTVVFEEVADFGEGIQPAVAILGGYRWLGGAVANVKPGQTVDAGVLTISGSGFESLGASKVTWHPDGSRLGYVFAECAGVYRLSPQPVPGDVGVALLDAGSDEVYPCTLVWGPTAATADRFLYTMMGVFDDGGIYLATEGGGAGTKLVDTPYADYGEFIHDVAWLPDGSGFLFSGFLFPDEGADYDYAGNLYHYDFATSAITQLSAFSTQFVRAFSVSPDGAYVVFELEHELAADDPPEVWLMRLDGGDLRRLAANARAPAWSR